MQRWFSIVLAMVGSVVLGAALVSTVTPKQGAAELAFSPPRIAVIDVVAVLESMKRRVAIEDALMKEFESKKTVITEKQAELEGIKGEMALVKAGSDVFRALEKKLVYAQAEIELDQKKFLQEFESSRASRLSELMEEIRGVTEGFVRERGIELVIERSMPTQPDMMPWEIVFYAEDHLVITDEILEILNKNQ